MKVKVDVVDGLRLIISNDFHWEYPEDEISLIFIEETRDDLIIAAARILAMADMEVHNVQLERITYVEYEDKKLLIEERDRYGYVIDEHEQFDSKDIIEQIQKTVPYKLALAEHQHQLERERLEKLAADERHTMQRELAQLTRLKAKYEDE